MSARYLLASMLLLMTPALLGVAGKVAPCDPAGADFCGLERAEDVAPLPGSYWLAISTGSTVVPLLFIDASSGRRLPVTLGPAGRPTGRTSRSGASGASACPGAPAGLRAGGNDVKRTGHGWRLAVLNRAAPGTQPRDGEERVELFDLAMGDGAPQATWVGCVPIPAALALNDVALAPDGSLFGSHQFDRPATPDAAAATRRQWLAGEPTGYAVHWTRRGGWERVAGTDVSFANGIAVSPDGRALAVAGTYSSAVLRVDLRNHEVRRMPLPLTPDNVTALPNGHFLVAGHTGIPVTGIDPCRDPQAVPCGFPFAIVDVGPRGELRRVFEHDGSRIPGASVAVPAHGRLYLGSFFGDRVTVVAPQPEASSK